MWHWGASFAPRVPLYFLQILLDDYHIEKIELKEGAELIGEHLGQFLGLVAGRKSFADTQYGLVALRLGSCRGWYICAHIVIS
jgi:hypothetical protein